MTNSARFDRAKQGQCGAEDDTQEDGRDAVRYGAVVRTSRFLYGHRTPVAVVLA